MRQRYSSLPLQVVIYFNGWYLALLYLAELALTAYKALLLPYPARNLGAEIVLLLFLALLDAIRIFLGAKGNLTERKLPLLLSLVFILPVFFGYLYLILWQTYVLRVELVILVIAFTGLALELVLGIITLWIFQSPPVLSNKHALFAVWKVASFNTFCFTWESLSYMGWAPAVYGLVIISLFFLSIFYQKE